MYVHMNVLKLLSTPFKMRFPLELVIIPEKAEKVQDRLQNIHWNLKFVIRGYKRNINAG